MVYLVFALSLMAVTKGADWLVEGAVGLARWLGVSQIVVGATIISLGTTLPEMLISSLAAARGKSAVVLGTALGSILFNTAVILGLAATLKPPFVERDCFLKAGTMTGVLILFALLASDLHISRWESLLLAGILVVFLVSNILSGRQNHKHKDPVSSRTNPYSYLWQVGSGAFLVVTGAHYLLNSGVGIARIFGIPEAIIAFTLFAAGSSLPELITAISAACKGYTDLILGNVLGANTLNIVFVMAAAGLIRPFAVDPAVLMTDVPLALLLMGLLFFPAVFTKKISRVSAILAVLFYFSYVAFRILTF